MSTPELTSANAEIDRLRALIGDPPVGSHPDEWMPRAATWHRERLNWIAETKALRDYIAKLEGQSLAARGLPETPHAYDDGTVGTQ